MKSSNSGTGVTGYSAIDHRLRVQMGLSCEEYVLADYFILQLFNGEKNWTNNLYKETGINSEDFQFLCVMLRDKGYIEFTALPIIKLTPLLRTHFRYDENFTQLYRLFQKMRSPLGIGNKKKCEKLFFQCIKKIPGPMLLEKATAYAALKKGTEPAYILQLETYLNPNEQRWNDNHRQSGDQIIKTTIINL